MAEREKREIRTRKEPDKVELVNLEIAPKFFQHPILSFQYLSRNSTLITFLINESSNQEPNEELGRTCWNKRSHEATRCHWQWQRLFDLQPSFVSDSFRSFFSSLPSAFHCASLVRCCFFFSFSPSSFPLVTKSPDDIHPLSLRISNCCQGRSVWCNSV